MESNKMYGMLFNAIEIKDENHLELILETMDKNSSLYFLFEAIKYANSKGVFTIGESEIIAKSIRVLNK